jgi:hypothetical protein
MLLAPDIPSVYHAMFSVPNLALENAMACRVYRAVKLGFINNHQNAPFEMTLRSLSAPDESSHELAFKQPVLNESRSVHVSMDITKTAHLGTHDDRASGKRASLVEEGSGAYDRV